MSDSCPILTDRDIELFGEFRNEIAEIQSKSSDIEELIKPCSNGTQIGGAPDLIVNVVYLIVRAIAAGATVGFLLYALPQSAQASIVSFVNNSPSFPVCSSNLDYVVGTTSGMIWNTMSCSHRAEMLEMAVGKIMLGVGAVTGLTEYLIKDKIRNYLDGKRGGKKKSRRTRRTRRTKRTRTRRMVRKIRKK